MLKTLGYISALLMIFSVIPYSRSVLKLETKPQRMTWFIWSILIIIAFFSQLAEGASWSLFLTGGDMVAIFSVFFLSLKYGVGGFRKIDILSLVGAGLSLLLWYITKEASIALFFIILSDFIGGTLTISKAWKDPQSENWIGWAICGLAGLLGAISVGEWNFILLAFPIYVCLMNSLIAFIVLFRRKVVFV